MFRDKVRYLPYHPETQAGLTISLFQIDIPKAVLDVSGETEEEFVESVCKFANEVDGIEFVQRNAHEFLPYEVLNGEPLKKFTGELAG